MILRKAELCIDFSAKIRFIFIHTSVLTKNAIFTILWPQSINISVSQATSREV